MTTDFSNMSDREYLRLNGTLSLERIERLLDATDLFPEKLEYEISELIEELTDRNALIDHLESENGDLHDEVYALRERISDLEDEVVKYMAQVVALENEACG